jgi:hypothetical protein
MIQRTALFAASLVAALVLAVGLVFAGFGPGAASAPVAADQIVSATDAPPQPTVQVDTVYLSAQAKPKVITETRTTSAAPKGDDDENESDDD